LAARESAGFTFLVNPADGAVDHLDPAPLFSPTFYRVAAP
jgi:hypothetical protein